MGKDCTSWTIIVQVEAQLLVVGKLGHVPEVKHMQGFFDCCGCFSASGLSGRGQLLESVANVLNNTLKISSL